MTSFYNAIFIFLKNPAKNYQKVLPYLNSYFSSIKRVVAEFFGIEIYSKPYTGHTELMEEINFRNGFFVECGGNDGIGFDPTYYLEKFRGWSGIIIEPLPRAAKACKKNRPKSIVCQTALVSYDHHEECIDMYYCNFMSITAATNYNINEWIKKGEAAQHIETKKFSVPAMTLDAVLKNNKTQKTIDLLVMDVEGSEAEILKGFSLGIYRPRFMLIEMASTDLKQEVEAIIGKKYTLIRKIRHSDYLYKLKAA